MVAYILRHLPQPPQELVWRAQGRQIVVDAHQDLLSQVFAVSHPAHPVQTNCLDEGAVLGHHVGERRRIALHRALDDGDKLHHRGSSPPQVPKTTAKLGIRVEYF